MHIDILDEIVVDREAKETMHYVRVIETKVKRRRTDMEKVHAN